MALHPLTDLSDLLAELPPRAAGTKVVAIDGPSGSGKTTLARHLRAVLSAPSIHMDAIYPGWDGLGEAPALLAEQVLAPLAAGQPAAYRRWDWAEDRWAESHPVPPAPVLIVEGVGSAAARCAPYLSLLIWIEAGRDVRLRRGLERDGETYRPHWERWAGQEVEMFARDRTRERADVLIDGDPDEDLDLTTEYVRIG